jgi:hypothetical protein
MYQVEFACFWMRRVLHIDKVLSSATYLTSLQKHFPDVSIVKYLQNHITRKYIASKEKNWKKIIVKTCCLHCFWPDQVPDILKQLRSRTRSAMQLRPQSATPKDLIFLTS